MENICGVYVFIVLDGKIMLDKRMYQITALGMHGAITKLHWC